MVEERMILALINFLLSLGVSVIAFCRLNAMVRGLSWYRIAPYALMLTAGLVSAFQPWLGQWPTKSEVFCSAAMLVYFYSTRFAKPRGI